MIIKEKIIKILNDKKIVFTISIVIVFLLSYVLFYHLIFKSFDIDFISKINKNWEDKINNNLIIVEIDDKTLNNLWFPLERKNYIPFLDNLNTPESKPEVIWFDILFMDKSNSLIDDENVTKKIKELWNIILPIDIKSQQLKAIEPYELFKNSAKNLAYVLPVINPINTKVYSIYPALNLDINWEKKSYEALWFSLVREYFNKSDWNINTNLKDKNYNFLDWLYNVPLSKNYFNDLIDLNYFFNYSNKKKEFHIKYSPSNKFKRISFYDIYTWKFDKSLLKDKIVLVWFTAKWVKDDFIIPWIWITKWVYIHANVINTLLNNSWYIYHFNPLLEIFVWIFFIIIIILSFYFTKKIKISLVILTWLTTFLLFSILWNFLFLNIFKSENYFVLNFFYELISLFILAFIFWIYYRYTLEDKNKILLSKALWEYVSKEISDEILNWKWNINLSWENKKITIFFSDIAWFTTISEKLSPEKLVDFLKIYLWKMSDIIIERRWFINKYEWDAIMALWWVFWKENKNWIIDACNSCLEQQLKIKELNEVYKEEWKDEISVRMWLHSGNAIIWNIWSIWKKMEFTALWDNVNLASRLEWVNKFYGTLICTSEIIYEEAKNDFVFRYLDIIRVKWKNIWVRIYELVWKLWEVKEEELEQIKQFEIWVKYYSNQEFDKAIEIFIKLSNLWNKTSLIYLKRCQNFITNPPPNNWDGIYNMEEK